MELIYKNVFMYSFYEDSPHISQFISKHQENILDDYSINKEMKIFISLEPDLAGEYLIKKFCPYLYFNTEKCSYVRFLTPDSWTASLNFDDNAIDIIKQYINRENNLETIINMTTCPLK